MFRCCFRMKKINMKTGLFCHNLFFISGPMACQWACVSDSGFGNKKKINSQYFFFYCTDRVIWNMVMKIINCRTHWLPLSWMCMFLQKNTKHFDVSDNQKGLTNFCLMRQNFVLRVFLWRVKLSHGTTSRHPKWTDMHKHTLDVMSLQFCFAFYAYWELYHAFDAACNMTKWTDSVTIPDCRKLLLYSEYDFQNKCFSPIYS